VGDSGGPQPCATVPIVRRSAPNVRWGITSNLTLTGTYRPDFAEVEADATKLVIDPRNAIFLS